MRPDCTPLKTCTKCGYEFPVDRGHFYGRQHGERYVFDARCKTCTKAQTAAYGKAHPEQTKAYAAAGRERHRDKRREYNRRYDDEHRAERSAYKSEWMKKNPEKSAEYHRRWAERHPEYTKEKTEQYYESMRAAQRRYRRKHPEYTRSPAVVSGRRNYAARRKGATGSHTQADILDQYKRQRGRCYWCRAKVGGKYHVDHVMPLAKGGATDPTNLVISCPTCNSSRKAKLPHEWSDRLC